MVSNVLLRGEVHIYGMLLSVFTQLLSLSSILKYFT